jgi:hypothetical protein
LELFGAAPLPLQFHRERRLTVMLWIIAIVLIAIGAVAVFGFALHFLFSPLFLVAALLVLAWVKLRPRRSRS